MRAPSTKHDQKFYLQGLTRRASHTEVDAELDVCGIPLRDRRDRLEHLAGHAEAL